MYRRTGLTASLTLALLAVGTWTAQGQQLQGPNTGENEIVQDVATTCQIGPGWLIGSQGLLLFVVLIGLPLFSRYKCKLLIEGKEQPPLKGLNLPEGSVRSMIALLIIGSFLNVLAFGGCLLGEHFTSVLAAFGTLAGSVLGFYFGSRKEKQ